ncbi:MED7 protein-domain-containing protein [Cubamyces lactineus]|nr:MED7 protein-domain-containing protein [Cubamyces lactineus]
MDDEETELRNPFPSPPSHYARYTNHNLKLLSLLRERLGPDADLYSINQYEVLSDQTDLPDWPLAQLEKPRVDWILEEGHYTVFGDTWFIKEKIPSLAELGGHQLYPADPSVDRRPALRSVLRSILVTYSKLLSALLLPPPTASSAHIEPEWKRHLEWINVLAQNIMAAANDLRPVQARGNLELMMRRQVELRREETKTIHSKCDALEAQLAELRLASQPDTAAAPSAPPRPVPVAPPANSAQTLNSDGVSIHDVLSWAEEVS